MSASASVEPDIPVTGQNGFGYANGLKSEEPEGKSIDLQKATSTFQDRSQAYLVDQTRHVVIPSFARWFNMNDIHAIEKSLFPDYFPEDESKRSIYKTADTYRYHRDFMINCYRLNPLEYLTVTALRRSLAGDVTGVIRIHHFLEKWGLINYQVDPRTKSTSIAPQYTGHFQVTLDTPKGLVPFVPEDMEVITETPKSPVNKDEEMEGQSPATSIEPETTGTTGPKPDLSTIPLNMEVRRNVYNDSKESFKDNINQYVCNITGKDTNQVRYHNLKSKGLQNNQSSTVNNASNISEECFEQGLFPSNFQSSNFIKITEEKESESWSEQEILLLLEGIEMYGSFDLINNSNINQVNSNANGQWIKISEHVGSKSKEQCMVKFIQLPIEDRYLNKLIDKKSDKDTNRESIIQEIVTKLLEQKQGVETVKKNANQKLEEISSDEINLIHQISELTLEKVNAKLNNLTNLENNLMKVEGQLSLERKQIAIERWLQYEKIYKFKQANPSPELEELLNDLLTPVKLHEIDSNLNKRFIATEDKIETKPADSETSNVPISVSKPQAYQFWSG